MYCEHPTCSLEASTICKYHCHLSVCEQHRIEHEKKLLIEFENQLDDLSNPISSLLNQSRYDLKQSEESRQCQLNRINSLFDRQSSSIDQRLKFSNKTNELISTKRQQLIKYKNGDNQLTKEDYQQIETLSNQVQTNLQEQRQLTTQICDHNSNIDLWPIQSNKIEFDFFKDISLYFLEENNVSKEIECIELSDSE
jgi:tRNA U34 5-carboxymethylaminomethyl modifying enzyme MnmG/GidA